MKLIDLAGRSLAPGPWAEAENIPWSEPGFSERMLREHLSQHHDRASRRAERIDLQVRWLHEEILGSRPSRVLDLACGPGLYTERLAGLGHECIGIDFSPAAIAHARRESQRSRSACRYEEADIRTAAYGEGYDLCTFVHGEFNSLRRDDAETVLRRAHTALAPGGRLVVEAHTPGAVRDIAAGAPRWHTAEAGLFSERPHLVLWEGFFDDAERAATERYFVVDLETAAVVRLATTTQSYSEDEYREMLAACGFGEVRFVAAMGDEAGAKQDGLLTIVATR